MTMAPILERADVGLAERYFFDDFTTSSYRQLLALAAGTWTFRGFSDAHTLERFVIWRHDIDCSIHRALALARIEADAGVRATYFVLLHSEMYNPLERGILARLHEIADLGHHIGLHFDASFHGIESEEQLAPALQWEARLLQHLLGHPVTTFSFHNPTATELSWQRDEYAGMTNAYATRFQTSIGYVSDSNGYWRHRRLREVLEGGEDRQLQVLTHPEWWTDEAMSPAARIERCISGRAAATRSNYAELLRRGGRLNVGA